MKASQLGVGAFIAMGLIAGCGALQQPQDSSSPNGALSSVPQEAVQRRPMPQGTAFDVPRPGPRRAGWISPAAKIPAERLLYGSEYYMNDVVIYPEAGHNQSPIGTISTGIAEPWGLYVYKGRTLYVANSSGSTVTVYPPGSTSPTLTYSADLSRPLYPIVDRYGNLFVGNANAGTVIEYKKGSTSPYQVLQVPGSEADGMDFDKQGNLYVAYRAAYGIGSIEEFAPGSTQGTSLGMTLNQPQGVVVDDAGNILVVETGGTDRIDVFPPGQTTPSVEVPIANTPNQIAIKRNRQRTIYVTTEGGPVYAIKYPFSKSSKVRLKEQLESVAQGVALSNGQHF